MDGRASSHQPGWPRMLIGAVLLWRALSVASLADLAELPDARFHGDWSSPGLNRSVKLAFANPCAWLPALPAAHAGDIDLDRAVSIVLRQASDCAA